MAELKEQTIEKEFVPYKIALALKELGFNHLCFGWYNYELLNLFGEDNLLDGYAGEENRPLAPTFSQAFRFFREKYKLHSCIVLPINKIDYAYEIKNISENIRQDFLSEMQSGIIYSSYEKAELACIRKLIEIAKEQNVK